MAPVDSCRCRPASTWRSTWPARRHAAFTCRACTCNCSKVWPAKPSPRADCASCCRPAWNRRPGWLIARACGSATRHCCCARRWRAGSAAGSVTRWKSRRCCRMGTCACRWDCHWNTPAPVRHRPRSRARPTPNASARTSPPRGRCLPRWCTTGWRPSAAWPPPRTPSVAVPRYGSTCAPTSTNCRWCR